MDLDSGFEGWGDLHRKIWFSLSRKVEYFGMCVGYIERKDWVELDYGAL